jgi:hypothetical protein
VRAVGSFWIFLTLGSMRHAFSEYCMTPEAMRVGLVHMVPLTDQEYVLLKAKPLMQFLQDHAPPVASEVRQSYVETMGKIVQVLVWACSTQFVAVLCLIPWPMGHTLSQIHGCACPRTLRCNRTL